MSLLLYYRDQDSLDRKRKEIDCYEGPFTFYSYFCCYLSGNFNLEFYCACKVHTMYTLPTLGGCGYLNKAQLRDLSEICKGGEGGGGGNRGRVTTF